VFLVNNVFIEAVFSLMRLRVSTVILNNIKYYHVIIFIPKLPATRNTADITGDSNFGKMWVSRRNT
jgi:hypothetical protein